MTKNIIFVWDQNPFNVRNEEGWGNPEGSYWGIGDILKGILTTYEICKKYNYDFYIDFQKHPISKYLKTNNHPFYEVVKKEDQIPFVWKSTIEDYILKSEKEIIMIMNCQKYEMNNLIINQPDKIILNYLKRIFTPNKSFSKIIENTKMKHNISNDYSIFHFRLGECDKLIKHKRIDDNLIKKCINIYSKYKSDNMLVISDSMLLKNKLKKYKVLMIDFENISHLGYDNNLQNVQNTLVEFLLMIEAKSISTFSKFRSVSGFAKYSSLIGNVPLNRIN